MEAALILASASPRRRELLAQIGVSCAVEPAHIDETPLAGEKPDDYVLRIACEKAAVVAARIKGESCPVLAADTSVVIDEDVLGKPSDRGDALGMLARLSGREHQVITAVCLVSDSGQSTALVSTDVTFRTLDAQLCEAYLQTDEPWDKAGGYAIQGLAGAFVRSIRGSYSNVVGLPLYETWEMLDAAGIRGSLSVGDAEHE